MSDLENQLLIELQRAKKLSLDETYCTLPLIVIVWAWNCRVCLSERNKKIIVFIIQY